MASTIFFNGRVTAIPGSYSEVDATGLAVIGLAAAGIVGVLGEAEGGSPWNGDTPVHRISNPAKVGRTFRQGDLVEAGNMIFDPSSDDQITAGAQEGKFVKVNPATQSTGVLVNGDGDVFDVTSRDYGLFTTQINVSVADGTNQGKAYTIIDGSTGAEELFDDVGGDPAFTALYTPGADGADTMTMVLDNTVGVEANWTMSDTGLRVEYTGSWGQIDGDPLIAAIVAGNAVDIISTAVGDTTQSVTIIGIVNGTGLPGTEVLALNGTTLVVGATLWDKVLGVVIDAATAGTITVRDATTTTTLTTFIPGQTEQSVFNFFGDIFEIDNDTVTLVADGATVGDVIVVGKDIGGSNQLELITLNGTTPVAGTAGWSEVQYLAVADVLITLDLTITTLGWNKGDVVSLVSTDPGDTTQRATIYGTDGSDQPQTETVTLNGTTPVAGVATWNQVLAVVLDSAAAGTVTVTGAFGFLVAYSLAPAELSKGFELVDNVAVSGTVVNWTDDAVVDRIAGVVGLDALGAAQVAILTSDGSSQATVETWSEVTGLLLGHVEAATTVDTSGEAFNFTTAETPTVLDMANLINALDGWSITVGANAGPLLLSSLDNQAAVSVLTAAVFTGDCAFAESLINAQSQIVTFDKVTGATGPPDNTLSPIFLVGGIEGVTTFTDWQASLDLLREEFVNTVVPLTDDEAVHGATKSHCVYMGGIGRKERDCVLGAASGETLAQIKARAVALNTRHARLVPQDIVRTNTVGEREQFAPYFTGCIAAGMQAGSPVGESLTFKFLNVLDVIGNDTSYNLLDDGEELIQGGLCVVEKVQGVGFRWLRNITTYLIDDNLAFTEASVNEAANFAAFNVRTNLEFAVGQKGFQGTVNAAASNVIATLAALADPEVQAITNWQNLTVELEADVMTVDVEIAPVIPTNFVKTTIHLVLASFSAAA